MNLLQVCYVRLNKGNCVLDLGAGDGRIAHRLAELGGRVTAVDRVPVANAIDGVTFIEAEAVDYVDQLPSTEQYNLIFLRNLIQFLDVRIVLEQFLPKLKAHVVPGGLIAIGTFYQNPDPPFERPVRSTYTLQDLRSVFSGWPEVFADQRQELTNDLRGQERLFFVTEIMIRRP